MFNDPSSLLIYLVIGCVAGTTAGLLGVGGGLLIVPALIWHFEAERVPAEVLTQLAVGTSLATIVFTALSSIWAHHRQGGIVWALVWRLTLGILLGSWFGARFAVATPGAALQGLLGVFALGAGIKMFWAARGADSNAPVTEISVTPAHWLPGAGLFIGATSSFFGIGGGTLTVPLLTALKLPIRKAVGTSAACGLPIALAGAASFASIDTDLPALNGKLHGLVHLPALFGIVLASTVFARLGALWAHRMPKRLLKRIFAGLLTVVGTKLCTGALY